LTGAEKMLQMTDVPNEQPKWCANRQLLYRRHARSKRQNQSLIRKPLVTRHVTRWRAVEAPVEDVSGVKTRQTRAHGENEVLRFNHAFSFLRLDRVNVHRSSHETRDHSMLHSIFLKKLQHGFFIKKEAMHKV
jgi:hypothetical protein